MQIIIDTREQLPLPLPNAVKKTLPVGDYTTARLFKKFAVERKSPSDLYGTVLGGHKRFRRMLLKAKRLGITVVVVVECSSKVFYSKTYDGAEYQPYPSETIKKIINTIRKRYELEFIWCPNRKAMVTTVIKQLTLKEKKYATNTRRTRLHK